MRAGSISTNFPMPREGKNAVPLRSFSFLLIHPEYGPILFDSGSPTQEGLFRSRIQELFGIDCEDIRWVFHTHLHADHIGNNRQCPNAKIVFSRRELQHVLTVSEISCGHGDLLGYYREVAPEYSKRLSDFDLKNIRYFARNFYPTGQLQRILGLEDNRALIIENGDRLPECISVIPTPGHSFGSVTYKLSLEHETFYITGDAASNRYAFLTSKNDSFDEPAIIKEDYKKSLETIIGLQGIFVPGHDRPFRSGTLKSIKKSPFNTDTLTI